MKKNFLITTGLIDTWEFNENNFLLGKWCEFYEFNVSNKRKPMNQIPKEISIIRNVDHWNDGEKRMKDYEYVLGKYSHIKNELLVLEMSHWIRMKKYHPNPNYVMNQVENLYESFKN